jgi:hypothetical protein
MGSFLRLFRRREILLLLSTHKPPPPHTHAHLQAPPCPDRLPSSMIQGRFRPKNCKGSYTWFILPPQHPHKGVWKYVVLPKTAGTRKPRLGCCSRSDIVARSPPLQGLALWPLEASLSSHKYVLRGPRHKEEKECGGKLHCNGM